MSTEAAPKRINPVHWKQICKAIYTKKWLPFLGAGANVSPPGVSTTASNKQMPMGFQVVYQLLQTMAEDDRLGEPGHEPYRVTPHPGLVDSPELIRVAGQDLAKVSMSYRHTSGHLEFKETLVEILDDEECEPSLLLHTLAALEPELIITANFDCLMERALADRLMALSSTGSKRRCFRIIQPPEGFKMSGPEREKFNREMEMNEGTVLYKIHGQLKDNALAHPCIATFPSQEIRNDETTEEANRWPVIVAEDDYIRFLTIVLDYQKGMPRWISAKMTKATLLFLGYSLEDWDFRALYEALILTRPVVERPLSFAIQKEPKPFWVSFWRDHNVVIYDVDLTKFAIELKGRYEEYKQREDKKKLAGGKADAD